MRPKSNERATLTGVAVFAAMAIAANVPGADTWLVNLAGSKRVADGMVALLGIVFLALAIGIWWSAIRHVKATTTLNPDRRRFWSAVVHFGFVFGAIAYCVSQMRWSPTPEPGR